MLYTLYAFKSDGAALTFEMVEMADDTQASARAERMLTEHVNCAHVEVWETNRQVMTKARPAEAG